MHHDNSCFIVFGGSVGIIRTAPTTSVVTRRERLFIYRARKIAFASSDTLGLDNNAITEVSSGSHCPSRP